MKRLLLDLNIVLDVVLGSSRVGQRGALVGSLGAGQRSGLRSGPWGNHHLLLGCPRPGRGFRSTRDRRNLAGLCGRLIEAPTRLPTGWMFVSSRTSSARGTGSSLAQSRNDSTRKILIYAEAFHGCPFVYRNESDSVARIGRTPVADSVRSRRQRRLDGCSDDYHDKRRESRR